MDSAYNKLIALGIRPSIQRVAIMKYLLSHHTHPTVEEVFVALKKQLPTVSRTTVYNTLRMLSEHGAALMITIDDHRVCYDGVTEPHAHFFCTALLQGYLPEMSGSNERRRRPELTGCLPIPMAVSPAYSGLQVAVPA